MSESRTQMERKPEEDDRDLYCVYYKDLRCPVQEWLRDQALIKTQLGKMEPSRLSDTERIAKNFVNAFSSAFNTIASFCTVCPHLQERSHEEYTKKLEGSTEKPRFELTLATSGIDEDNPPEEARDLIKERWDRGTWMNYIAGYLVSAGFRFTKPYKESFMDSFPELDEALVDLLVSEEKPEIHIISSKEIDEDEG